MRHGTRAQQNWNSTGPTRGDPAARSDDPDRNVSHAGILRDAMVMTARGPRVVQRISRKDLIIVRGAGALPVRRIETASLVTHAVYVIAGSLGHRQIDRDTLLPSGQAVLVRDWRAQAFARCPEVMLPASALVDGEYVRDIGQTPMTVYRLYFDTPCVIYADGMELGSGDINCAQQRTYCG